MGPAPSEVQVVSAQGTFFGKFRVLKRLGIGGQSGQSAVEFAVILPLVIVVILALADFGRALFMYLEAEHAASDAARVAAVDTTPPAGTSLQNYLKQQLTFGELGSGSGSAAGAQGAAKLCITLPEGTDRGDPVNVKVTSSFNWVPGGVIPGSVTIGGSATMRLEQIPSYSAGCST
jgi:Flp pilus assembly protein TadG